MDTSQSSYSELLGGAVVALGVIAIGLQKLIKGWKSDNAETSVITLMHSELERMSAQNTKLGEELNKLQIELITLNAELGKLTLENQRLHAEVVHLTSEISRLKAMLPSKDKHGN